MRNNTILAFILILVFTANFALAQPSESLSYRVQAGFYKNNAVLENSYRLLKQRGFPVYKVALGDGVRLYVGNFNNKDHANKVAKQLQDMGFETLVRTQRTTIQQPSSAAADPPKKNPEPEQNLVNNVFLPQDVTIKGIYGGHNVFFFVDEHWVATDNCYLNLIFSQSEIKKYKNSTLTVHLNDVPIRSITLADKDNYKAVEKVQLPKEHMVKGYNYIKFSTYHRITDEPCTDDLNPANWLVFHKESYIHLEYKEIADQVGLKDYPYPYLKTSAKTPVNCIIAVPDNPTSNQITAATIIATDFGRRVPYNNVDVKVMPYKELAGARENTNLIVIGSPADSTQALFKPVRSDLSQLTDKAMIKETVSPSDQAKRILYLVSANDTKLISAAKALTQDNLISQMQGTTQFIWQDFVSKSESKKDETRVTLQDLGYEDTLLRGIFFQQATFGVHIPQNYRLREESFLQLPLRYSKALDFSKSSVSVYLNNIPITDKLLNEEQAENDELKVNIPKEFWGEDFLELKLVFYLEPHGFDCTNWRHGDIWALVSKDASFNIPQEIVRDRYFQHYPGLFIKDGTPDDLLLVLPDQPNGHYLTMAANIMAFIGHNLERVDNIKVVTSSEFQKAGKQKNIIMLGTPQHNNAIKLVNDNLHISFNKTWDQFEPNDKISLIPDYNQNVSSIQLLRSPFDIQKHLMVVTATGEKNLTAAGNYLKDLEFNTRLVGDGVVIDNDGHIQEAYFTEPKDTEVESQAPRPRHLSAKWQDNPQFIMYVVFFVMLILTGIYGVIVVTRGK